MATTRVKVKISSGKSGSNGTVLVRQHVVIVKNNAQAKPYGRPIYQTKAQLNLHLDRGTRPTKTQLRRLN